MYVLLLYGRVQRTRDLVRRFFLFLLLSPLPLPSLYLLILSILISSNLLANLPRNAEKTWKSHECISVAVGEKSSWWIVLKTIVMNRVENTYRFLLLFERKERQVIVRGIPSKYKEFDSGACVSLQDQNDQDVFCKLFNGLWTGL